MGPLGIRVATPRPPPRAYILLVIRRPSDLVSMMEPWVPAAATCQEALLRNPFQDIGLARMATGAAAIGTSRGGDIPRGCTCRTKEWAAVSTVYWPHNAQSVAAFSLRNRLPLDMSWELLAWGATIPHIHVKLLRAQGRGLVEFEGGLTWACSRLGRRASSTAPWGLRRSQFVGTSRCLGRTSSTPMQPVRDSPRALLRGARRYSGHWTSTRSASRRSYAPRSRRREWMQRAALLRCGHVWRREPPRPASGPLPLAMTTTSPTPPPGLRCMQSKQSRRLAKGAS